MEKDVAHALLKTFAFFDLFQYPLTSYEAWKWLISETPVPFTVTLDGLEDLRRRQQLSFHNGFYCLPRKERLVAQRRQRFRDAEPKWKKALAASTWLSRFPFVRMVAISNTLSYSNASSDSDIDFFIITEAGRIWTARFFSALFFHLRGQRPTPERMADTICLSFWVSEAHLDLLPIAIGPEDIYLRYWIAQLVPVYDPDDLYREFWQSNAALLRGLPHVQPAQPHRRRQSFPRPAAHPLQTLSEGVFSEKRGRAAENFLKSLQLRRLPPNLKQQMNQGKGVVVHDDMLKFHDHDRRKELSNRWTSLAEQLLQNYDHQGMATQATVAR